MQSRMMSAVEAATNVAVGYAVSLVATALILPAFGYHVSGGDAVGISAAFTLVSLVRSFVLRRMFNAITARRRLARCGL